jgi:hypothetical protein
LLLPLGLDTPPLLACCWLTESLGLSPVREPGFSVGDREGVVQIAVTSTFMRRITRHSLELKPVVNNSAAIRAPYAGRYPR